MACSNDLSRYYKLIPPHPGPVTLQDGQLFPAGMDKVELALRILLVQAAIALQGDLPIGAAFDHGQATQAALVLFGMRFQGFDHQPLIGVSLANFTPLYDLHPVIFENLLDHGFEAGDFTFDDTPDNLQINIIIAVNDAVTHTGHIFPSISSR